jgi:peptide/nickel transport system substrate-binding protein
MREAEHLNHLLANRGFDPMSRRELLRRLGAGAGALGIGGWLAACGSSSSSSSAAARGKRGGTLTVGADADAYVLSGNSANVGQYPLNANIFEGLVRMDSSYGLVPVLATSWEFRPPNTWRFHLRKGVKFHNGTTFTAKDVKWTFDKIATRDAGGTPGLQVKGNVIVDDYTIDVTPSFPNQRLVEQIVEPGDNWIIAYGTDTVHHLVGTGPFRFASYQREQQLVVKRFAGYWGKPALLDQINFKFIPDAGARLLALQSGNVDVMLVVPNQDVGALKSGGFKVYVSPVGAYEAFYCNISGKKGYTICQNGSVRKALEYGIDRHALVKGVYQGQAVVEQTMIPSRLLGSANASLISGYGYDPAMAKQLLDSAGWKVGPDGIRAKGGKRLSLQLIDGFPSADSHTGVPEFVQAQYRHIGVDVSIIKCPDNATYTNRMNALQGDLWLEQGNQNDANPAFLPALLFSKKGLFGGSAYQTLFAPGGRFETLINEALSTPSESRVKSLVAQAMHVLIDQDAIVVPLAGIPRIAATSHKVLGFDSQPSQLQVSYAGVSLT